MKEWHIEVKANGLPVINTPLCGAADLEAIAGGNPEDFLIFSRNTFQSSDVEVRVYLDFVHNRENDD